VTACVAGTFKTSSVSSTACTECVAGKYKNETTQTNDTCTDCDAGKFKETAAQSSDTCGDCPVNSNSPVATGLEDGCLADAGYTGSGAAVTACVAGTFKTSSVSSTACTECGAGKYKNETTQTSDTCISCDVNSDSAAGSGNYTACLADAGYTGSGANVTACVAGTFKASALSSAACKACVVGQYTGSAAAEECSYCPANSVTVGGARCADATDAQVKDLFNQFEKSLEEAKLAGKEAEFEDLLKQEKELVGLQQSESCTKLLKNCTAAVASKCPVTCGTCPHIAASGSCDCAALTACVAGTFKGDKGPAACTNCSAGTIQPVTAQTSCDDCAVGKYKATAGQTQCDDCAVGKFENFTGSAACTDCSAGTIQPVTAQTSCDDCAVGKYMATTGQMKCDDCTAKTTSAARSVALTDCLGDAGYSGNGGNVAACEVGTFKSEAASSAACKDCAVGTFAAVAASTFCPACPNHSTSPAKSDEATDCACSVGYAGNITGSDMPADDKPADDKPADEKKKKRQMRRLMGKPSTAGDDSAATTITAIGSCDMCLAGTFKDSSGNGECTPCPANSNSSVGATLLNQCFGNVGYGGSGNSVSACSAGYFKKEAMSAANCSACPRGFSTNNLTTQGSCTVCEAKSHSPFDGSPACIECPRGWTTDVAGQYFCYLIQIVVKVSTNLRGLSLKEFDTVSMRDIFKTAVAYAFSTSEMKELGVSVSKENVVITEASVYQPSTLLLSSDKPVLLGISGEGTSAKGVTVKYAVKNVRVDQKDALLEKMDEPRPDSFRQALVDAGMVTLQAIEVYELSAEVLPPPTDSNGTVPSTVVDSPRGNYEIPVDDTTHDGAHEPAAVRSVGDDFPWWMWFSCLVMLFIAISIIVYAQLKRCHNQRLHDDLVRDMGVPKSTRIQEEEPKGDPKGDAPFKRRPQSENSVAPDPFFTFANPEGGLPPLSHTDEEMRLNDHFDTFDKDGSGLLSKEEFRSIMQLGGSGLSDEDFEELYGQIDSNLDGEIDFDEYVAWVTKSEEVK